MVIEKSRKQPGFLKLEVHSFQFSGLVEEWA